MVRIKICRVNDLETARALAVLGVDFIGLHLVTTPTDERLRHLAAIISYCTKRQTVTQPVLVTKNLTLAELCTAVQVLQPPFVQLHDAWSQEHLRTFRASFPAATKIIVVVDPVANVNVWISEHPELADYVLLDRIQGGTGKPLPDDGVVKQMHKFTQFPVFLAGGLNAENVAAAITAHKPFAVDVQTALEVPGFKGRKDIVKTLAFTKAVRQVGLNLRIPTREPILCLSLTDYPLADLGHFDPEVMAAVDVAHLDHADGSVDTRFVLDSLGHADQLHQAFPLQPYDLHLFFFPLASETIGATLDKYLFLNPFMRAVFCYLDPLEEAIGDWPVQACMKTAHMRRIGFGLSFQARELSWIVKQTVRRVLVGVSVDYISIVGPPAKASPEAYASIVGPFIRHLHEGLCSNVSVIVDRSITVPRLKALNNERLCGAVVGQSIWGAPVPLKTIEEFRQALAKPAHM